MLFLQLEVASQDLLITFKLQIVNSELLGLNFHINEQLISGSNLNNYLTLVRIR